MGFVLGSKSRANLVGVHPDLVRVVELAITLSKQDFRVHSGLRTPEHQRLLAARGVSWTRNSKHLRQPDGFAQAVDLVPLIDGRLKWDWPGCRRIAYAMALAGRQLEIPLRWGGVWDRVLGIYAHSAAGIEAESAAYVWRKRALGKRAILDGPHFELLI